MKKHLSFNNFLNEAAGNWSGVVITSGKSKLKALARKHKQDYMDGWKMMSNHATIKMTNLPKDYEFEVDEQVDLTVTHVGWSKTAIAVKIKGLKTFNTLPHVTLAFHPTKGKGGGTSNQITKWEAITNFKISGPIKEGFSSYPKDEGKL